MSEFFTTNRMVIWWHTRNGTYPMFNKVGIFRLMQRRTGKDSVIFECVLPSAEQFLRDLDPSTLVSVRYMGECGRIDNPSAGIVLYYIRNIVPKERWINRLATTAFSSEIVTVRLHADCVVDEVNWSIGKLE